MAAPAPPISPATRRPLKPGQRNPSWGEELEMQESPDPIPGGFPWRERWRICAENADRFHAAVGNRGEAALSALDSPGRDEFGLFVSDMLLWRDLRRRGLTRETELQYLRPGREHWGDNKIEALCRAYRAEREGGGGESERRTAARFRLVADL